MRLCASPPSCSVTPMNPTVISVSRKRQSSSFRCNAVTQKALTSRQLINEKLEANLEACSSSSSVAEKWMEYQGLTDWEGLLDPLDQNLRAEILRYGDFVEDAYKSFLSDQSSPSTLDTPKNSLETGYRITKNLRATSGIQLPRWTEKGLSWMTSQSSMIGYVAVCEDKDQIAKLGRRDVVVSLRGTATGLEWVENLRATLTPIGPPGQAGPMVETGFLSLYTSGNNMFPSLQDMLRQEVSRLLETYGDEPLSLTFTGHSLGAALATLAAYDIKTTFRDAAPMVTVISFGCPRVGNRSFRRQLEKQGTKILRIVNSNDVVTRVPGFVINNNNDNKDVQKKTGLPDWIERRVEDTLQLAYSEVGTELRLSSKDSTGLGSMNVAACHELKTYMQLVKEFS